jgi:hypothetical protein
MKTEETFISLQEIRDFYKEKCREVETEFSEDDFEKFVRVCERDFFNWLKENWNYYSEN